MSMGGRWFRGCAEIVVALLILAMLVGGVFGHPGGHDVRISRQRAAQAQAKRLAMVVEEFRNDCGRLPDRLDELFGVVRDRNCFTVPLRLSQLVDPWGSRLLYWRAGDDSAFELRSLGPDHTYGSSDDLTSGGWTWPWPQPPWSWEERGRRFGQITVAVLALLLVLALFWRFTWLVACAIRWLRRRFGPA